MVASGSCRRGMSVGREEGKSQVSRRRDLVVLSRAEALHRERTHEDDKNTDDSPFFHVHTLDKRVGSIQKCVDVAHGSILDETPALCSQYFCEASTGRGLEKRSLPLFGRVNCRTEFPFAMANGATGSVQSLRPGPQVAEPSDLAKSIGRSLHQITIYTGPSRLATGNCRYIISDSQATACRTKAL